MESAKAKKPFFKDEANLFVIRIVLIYAGWKVAHYFFLHSTPAVAAWWNGVVISMGEQYATLTSFILNLFGESTTTGAQLKMQHSTAGIWIIYMRNLRYVKVEEHCLAIPATLIFIGSIAFFSGSWKNKLWFIPMGVLCICLINLLRLVFLSIAFEYSSPLYFNLNHSFIYVVITYILIMALIVFWMKRFGNTAGIKATVKR